MKYGRIPSVGDETGGQCSLLARFLAPQLGRNGATEKQIKSGGDMGHSVGTATWSL